MIGGVNIKVARRRSRSVCLAAWVIVSLGFLLGACRAAVVIGNLPSNDGRNFQIGAGKELAVSFVMPNLDFTLDQVTLRLQDDVSGVPDISLRLNATGNVPGTLFASLTGASPTGTAADIDYTSNVQVTLQANTGYWLVVAAQSGQFNWNGSTPAEDPAGLATFGGFKQSSDDGMNWNPLPQGRASFAVNGTAVPEPLGGSVLMGMLCGFFVWLRSGSRSRSKRD